MIGNNKTVRAIVSCLLFLFPGMLFSQILNPRDEQGIHCTAIIVEGDTVPIIYLDQVYVAGIKFEEYNRKIESVSSEKEKKRMMKQAEDELQAQFGPELKELTFTQGKILLKLIDRQTTNTSYDIVREFRGRFMAFFWQGIGKLFGYNLKTKYDPLREDAEIERIVLMIENGSI